jgi:hypothetical protein
MFRDLWKEYAWPAARFVLLLLVGIQAWWSYPLMFEWKPQFSRAELMAIERLSSVVEDDAAIISLENRAAVWIRGWLPDTQVGAPGLFDFPAWGSTEWEAFLYGSNEERHALLNDLPRPLYFFTTPLFFSHYGDSIRGFMSDSCFELVEGTALLRVNCPASI